MDRKHIVRSANVSMGIMVAGGLLYYFGVVTVGGAVGAIGLLGFAIYGGTLFRMTLLEPRRTRVPGIEDLPPFKDLAGVSIDRVGDGNFVAADGERSKQILKCICTAKRISSAGAARITRKLQLRDKCGAEWEITAIRTNAASRNFA